MSAKKLLAIAVASLVLLGGVAAVGAASPADQAPENGEIDENATESADEPTENTENATENTEAPTENASAEEPADETDDAASHADEKASENASTAGEANENASANASENASAASESVGPADGLPAVVPDHVSTIHETIEAFLDGSIETLGDALSELSGSDAGDAPTGNDTAVEQH